MNSVRKLREKVRKAKENLKVLEEELALLEQTDSEARYTKAIELKKEWVGKNLIIKNKYSDTVYEYLFIKDIVTVYAATGLPGFGITASKIISVKTNDCPTIDCDYGTTAYYEPEDDTVEGIEVMNLENWKSKLTDTINECLGIN